MARNEDFKKISISKNLLKVFPEPKSQFHEDYKEWEKVRFIGGKTIVRTGTWHKALILVQNRDKLQLIFYGWNHTASDKWWHRQQFNLAIGSVSKLIKILDGVQLNFSPEELEGEE